MVPKGVRERIIARVVYSGPVQAPVEKGQKIGTLKVWRNESLVLEVPLQASEDVGKGTVAGRAWDAAGELIYGLFRAGVQKL
jgi:D-alanyl-D-alanine carboxypeptidase (penicillin-binding protein 5/6)